MFQPQPRYPIHDLDVAGALKAPLNQRILEVFIGLPKSQDANPAAVAFWGLLEAFLHPDATVAVADWTPQTEARLIEILQLDVLVLGCLLQQLQVRLLQVLLPQVLFESLAMTGAFPTKALFFITRRIQSGESVTLRSCSSLRAS